MTQEDIFQIVFQLKTASEKRMIIQLDENGINQVISTYNDLTNNEKKIVDDFLSLMVTKIKK